MLRDGIKQRIGRLIGGGGSSSSSSGSSTSRTSSSSSLAWNDVSLNSEVQLSPEAELQKCYATVPAQDYK